MHLSQFGFHLPKELIAQSPSRRRDQSRLLLLDRKTGDHTHLRFPSILDYLSEGDVLVVNNTKVFKARLLGNRTTGGKVELFLVRRLEDQPGEVYLGMVRPSRKLKPGDEIVFDRTDSAYLGEFAGEGQWRIRFESMTARRRIIARFGHVPLPQYIARPDQRSDLRRYQTLFARSEKEGAVAAPTAGFHFTRPLLERIRARGVKLLEVTLHVGPGTFKPIQVENINDHTVDPEFGELTSATAKAINKTRAAGGRIFVVGTTSVRLLESAASGGVIRPFAGPVDLYIKPGHRFQIVDHLITNFHLPKSSLLVLVSAFAGRELILKAYQEAIARQYRFYSYGDAMLIL